MRLEIGFMARTDAAQEPNHRPVLSQNMEYTRTVSRTLKPDLERRFTDQAAPPVGTWMKKRPRGIRQADEQGDSIRLEFSQGGTGDSDRSTRAIRQTISPGPPSKDSGESVKVSTNPKFFGDYSWLMSHLTDTRYVEG